MPGPAFRCPGGIRQVGGEGAEPGSYVPTSVTCMTLTALSGRSRAYLRVCPGLEKPC